MVHSVCIEIRNIVEHVSRRCKQANQDKCSNCGKDMGRLMISVAGDKGYEYY